MRPTLHDLDPARLKAQEALVATVRELNLAAGTAELDASELDEVTEELARLTRRLGAGRAQRVLRGGFLGPRDQVRSGQPITLHQLNPAFHDVDVVVGHTDGPEALDAALTTGDPSGLTATAELTVNALHEGPPDSVHGGVLSFLMDCMLGVLVQATGIPSVTGTLDLRYLHRSPLDQPLTLRASIVRRDGRKILAEGSVEHAGTRTVEASGLFVAVGERTP